MRSRNGAISRMIRPHDFQSVPIAYNVNSQAARKSSKRVTMVIEILPALWFLLEPDDSIIERLKGID